MKVWLSTFILPCLVALITAIAMILAARSAKPSKAKDNADTAKAISEAFEPVVAMLSAQLADSQAIIDALQAEVVRLQGIVSDFALALLTAKEVMRQNGMGDKIPPDPPGLEPIAFLMRGGVAGYSEQDRRRVGEALVPKGKKQ